MKVIISACCLPLPLQPERWNSGQKAVHNSVHSAFSVRVMIMRKAWEWEFTSNLNFCTWNHPTHTHFLPPPTPIHLWGGGRPPSLCLTAESEGMQSDCVFKIPKPTNRLDPGWQGHVQRGGGGVCVCGRWAILPKLDGELKTWQCWPLPHVVPHFLSTVCTFYRIDTKHLFTFSVWFHWEL